MNNEIVSLFSFVETNINLNNQFKNLYFNQLAPDFNALNFIDLNENKISEIFAFFLNPKGGHNQGDLFLKEFLIFLHLNFEMNNTTNVEVICEMPTSNKRRIDIVIKELNFKQAIGIENKIYDKTLDQANQLIDYITFLKKETNNNFTLLYLAPGGKDPSLNSISKDDRDKYEQLGNFKIINYQDHIIPCIRKFIGISENERVRSFLKDFQTKLEEWYLGIEKMNFMEDIKKYILEGSKIEMSFTVIAAINQIKTDLKKTFEDQLEEIASELKIIKDEKNLRFIPNNWNNHYISFNYEDGGILYGIQRKISDPKKSRLEFIEDLFQGKEKFKVSLVWPVYASFYSNIDNNHQFWTDVNSGFAKTRAKEFIETIINSKFETAM
jgi:hypothetical protein